MALKGLEDKPGLTFINKRGRIDGAALIALKVPEDKTGPTFIN